MGKQQNYSGDKTRYFIKDEAEFPNMSKKELKELINICLPKLVQLIHKPILYGIAGKPAT